MNVKTDNVLILSGDFGDGHKQAARAIAATAQESISPVETTIVDFVKWTHPHLHVVGNYCYTQWIMKLPSVYGFLFAKTRADNSLYSLLFKKMKMFSLNRMIKLVNEVRPSIVVSTFPPAAAVMSILKANGLISIPTVTVITDHTDHSYWIHPYTDHYLVGSEYVRQALLCQGVADRQITVTGIPIRPQFSLTYDPRQLRKKHGLQQTMTTVLIMGGGLGIISKAFIDMLQKENRLLPVQFIVICGHNKKLQEALTEQLHNEKHRFIIKGYVDTIHELMALSDLMITKPGGLTTSEAVALELPMLLYKPLPGQEQDNAAYLLQAEVAIQAKDEKDLLEKLLNALHDPQMLFIMKRNAQKIQTKTSAHHALTIIQNMQSRSFPNTEVRCVLLETPIRKRGGS